MTRIEESARSGYWRLFYYQLQEKALQTAGEEPAKPAKPPEAFKPSKPRVVRAKRLQASETRASECPEPRIRLLRPIRPKVEFGIPLPDMMWVYGLLNTVYFTFPQKRSIVKPSEALKTNAKSEVFEDEIVLLLLAA